VTTRVRASTWTGITLALALAACTGDARHGESPVEIRVGTFLAGGADRIAAVLSRDFLVTTEWDGRAVFGLAESGDEAPDGLSLTVRLRPGVTFHSGEPVTAGRVRHILETHAVLMREVTCIEVIGDDTLVIRLKRPHAVRLVDLSSYAILDDHDPELRTGPFRLVSDRDVVVLEPFPAYYEGPPPTVSRVEIHEYPTQRAAWTAMMRGEVDMLHEIDREAIDFLQAGGSIQAYPLLRPYYLAVVFNVRHPVLRGPAVRRALMEAVDREAIVRDGMRGHGQVADGPFWPHHWANAPQRHVPAYNPTAASVRLETAGLPMRHRPGAMPSRLAFTCLLLDDSRFEHIALLLQRQLSAVGVDMHLQALPQDELEGRIGAGAYDAFLFEFVSARTLSFPYQFWHSRTSPLSTGYASADEALDRMKAAVAEPDVRAAVADVLRIMRADPPAIFLAWPRDVRAADRSVELPYEPDRDVFGTLWQARRAPAATAGR
jgi:ABC-type transport system substrate-binding protein